MSDQAKWLFLGLRATILAPPDSALRTNYRTHSMQQDGISWEAERQLRYTTSEFIEELAALVEIPNTPCILAQLYVQRFYMLHAFSTHDRFLVATAALFLADKNEEFPIKVRLITECAMSLLYGKSTPEPADEPSHHHHHQHNNRKLGATNGARGRTLPPPAAVSVAANAASSRRRKSASGRAVEMSASLGNDPEAANNKHLECLRSLVDVDVGQIETTASRVLLLERLLLQTLSFDVSIPQPFAHVPLCVDKLFRLEAMHPSVSYDTIRTLAFLFLSDAVKSHVVLAFDSAELATAAVYLACLYRRHVSNNVATEKNEPWWTVWGLPAQQLEDAARGLLWMYEDNDGAKQQGLTDGMLELWDRVRPDQNLPDLAYIKQLDADLVRS